MSKPRLVLFLVLLVVLLLVIRENMTKRPDRLYQTTAGQIEMCLSCHTTEKLDAAHDRLVIGCSPCHLGDALAIDKEKAHAGIVKNPGDLRLVEKTCGIEGCHAADVKKVKNSLMATNRGILATLLYYWGEAPDQNGDYSVEKLLESGETSLALDYFHRIVAVRYLPSVETERRSARIFRRKGGRMHCLPFHQGAESLAGGGQENPPPNHQKGPGGELCPLPQPERPHRHLLYRRL